MRVRRAILAIALTTLFAPAASAQAICPQLAGLIEHPPAGFLADRAEPIGPQRWASRPFLPNANCVVWESRSAEAHNIRCIVNDGAPPAIVAAFYQDTERSIDQCLTTLADGTKYTRRSTPVDTEGLKGAETKWIFDSDALRFQIDLTNYRRTYDGSTYNSFSVEYLKY